MREGRGGLLKERVNFILITWITLLRRKILGIILNMFIINLILIIPFKNNVNIIIS